MIKKHMLRGGVPSDSVELVDIIQRYRGAKARRPGLSGQGSGDVLSKMTKRMYHQDCFVVCHMSRTVARDINNGILRMNC